MIETFRDDVNACRRRMDVYRGVIQSIVQKNEKRFPLQSLFLPLQISNFASVKKNEFLLFRLAVCSCCVCLSLNVTTAKHYCMLLDSWSRCDVVLEVVVSTSDLVSPFSAWTCSSVMLSFEALTIRASAI